MIKKILLLLIAGAVVLPTTVSAATAGLTMSIESVAFWETFTVAIYVNPGEGEKITTVKLSAEFLADKMEVVSFMQSDGWISLPVQGADLEDNTAGRIVKTAGFPGGVTETRQFGVVTLRAKGAGEGALTVTDDSMMLDPENNDRYVPPAGVSFVIEEPVQSTSVSEQSAVVEQESTLELKPNTIPAPTDTNTGISATTGANNADVASEQSLEANAQDETVSENAESSLGQEQTASVWEAIGSSLNVKTAGTSFVLIVLIFLAVILARRKGFLR